MVATGAGYFAARRQIAPTMLRLLGIDPNELQAVRAEHTEVLPQLG